MKCALCDAECATVEGMNEHIVINHDSTLGDCLRDLCCVLCGVKRTTEKKMKKHVANHWRYLYCLLCEERRKTEKKMIGHIVNHHDADKYASREMVEHGCRICGKRDLREHKRNEHGTKVSPTGVFSPGASRDDPRDTTTHHTTQTSLE